MERPFYLEGTAFRRRAGFCRKEFQSEAEDEPVVGWFYLPVYARANRNRKRVAVAQLVSARAI
jgi:hypothetical protein